MALTHALPCQHPLKGGGLAGRWRGRGGVIVTLSASLNALMEHEVAERLGLSVATLRAWRQKNRGPRYVRFGRAVRYLPGDLQSFIERSTIDTEAESAPHHSERSEELQR